MEVVAEALLSSVLDFLIGQMASSDLMKFAREERVHTELKKWKTELLIIQRQLGEAEEKQITDDDVRSWLNELRALAYDMEDVLDEFGYQVMRRKLIVEQADEPGTSNRKLSKFIPTCCSNFNPTHTVRLLNMGPKIRNITARLEDISVAKCDHVLKEAIGAANPAWRRSDPTTPIAYEPGIHGRDEDKKAVLDLLGKVETYESNFGVISIVGPGGVGKTTLARQIYNNEAAAEKFDLKAWACVSDVFHLENIMRAILNSMKQSDGCGSLDFQQVQRELRDALANKKFLLVLDDMWTQNPNHWNSLQAPLSAAAKGSKVIVTTRHRNTALMMGPRENLHELKPLSPDACYCVFEKEAFKFRNVADHQNLVPIGKKIVAECGGLPLAAKALGGLLHSKDKEEDWERVLNSKIWQLPSTECEILPPLWLSYHYLPSHLKRCFAYCAIFPKDYEFDSKVLVLLWMAEGLIGPPSSDNLTIEDQGDDYFQELFSRSFFQLSGDQDSYFVMHDLIHDLAQAVSNKICLCLEDNSESDQQFHIPRGTRHLSFTHGKFHLFKKFKNCQVLQHLRTFAALPIDLNLGLGTSLVPNDLMSQFQQLRVLSLSGYMISVLPDSVGGLIHLRYLNLSFTCIESLPDSINNLCNLQTLLLHDCERLTRLPNDIGNLISLRHLDVNGCPLQAMPQKIGRLKQLQTFSNFIVGKRGFLGIKELKDLSNLKGTIKISGLENVMDVEDARNANLKGKHKIENLSMIWGEKSDGSCGEDIEEQVLCSLQPDAILKNLTIEGYGGGKFPNWISNPSFSKLVVLNLIGCVKCKSVPPVGQLPILKKLDIQGMDGVESVGVEFEGRDYGHNKPFQCLEFLSFVGMKEWKEWSWSSQSFSRLRRLKIRDCPKIVGKVPTHLTSLVELAVFDSPKFMVPLPTDLHSLQKFEFYYYNSKFRYHQETRGAGGGGSNVTSPRLEFEVSGISAGIYQELKHHLPSAVELVEIDNTGRLECKWTDGFGVGNLQSVKISDYKQLVSFGDQEQVLEHGVPIKLTSLCIKNCESLKSLPGWIMMRNRNNYTPLEELKIEGCPSLICFPGGCFTSTLRKLEIRSCQSLQSLPEDMGMCGLEVLHVYNCSSLVGFPRGSLSPTLTELHIYTCGKLESLPKDMNRCALEELWVCECPGVSGFPEGGLAPTLKRLSIRKCEKLRCLPVGIIMPMHTHSPSALYFLDITSCPSITFFPNGKFPSTLKTLWIQDCVQLPPISNEMFDPYHNSLERLILAKYPKLKTIPDSLYNLQDLRIVACENLELHPCVFRNLTSLARLTIDHISPEATTFVPLPATLVYLRISGFPNLESLASLSLQTLTSLRDLYIYDCPKLHSFIPKEGLPDMLSRLFINDCPLLIQRCSEKTGEDWPKIAHIPNVCLDGRWP